MEKVTALLVFISAVLVTKPSPWRQTVSVYEWKKVGEGILCILLRAETVTGCHAPQQSDPPETKIKEGLSWLFEIYLIHFFLASMPWVSSDCRRCFFFLIFTTFYHPERILHQWDMNVTFWYKGKQLGLYLSPHVCLTSLTFIDFKVAKH